MSHGQAMMVAAVGDAIAWVILAVVVLFVLGLLVWMMKGIIAAKKRGEDGPLEGPYKKGHQVGWDLGQKLGIWLRDKLGKGPKKNNDA